MRKFVCSFNTYCNTYLDVVQEGIRRRLHRHPQYLHE
nr:MAG TPA: hypothetical protein [Bacteriophage sp.]